MKTNEEEKQAMIVYQYNDPGRFDVCRDCPLKTALRQLASAHKKA